MELSTHLKSLSIRPNKIVFYNAKHKFINENEQTKPDRPKTNTPNIKTQQTTVLPKDNHHYLKMSAKAQKNITEKVQWLNRYSRKKTFVNEKGITINGYSSSFVTLTLPSLQIHKTSEIITSCLNQFLIELKSIYSIHNYVWKVEYQQNGNAHFHIVIDAIVEYWRIVRVWNRCIEKLNYITNYATKFKELTFKEYYNLYAKSYKDFEILKKRYFTAKLNNWQNPNTADVKYVKENSNIGGYIAKYMTKNISPEVADKISKREFGSKHRLWYCSLSLSRLVPQKFICESLPTLVFDFLNTLTQTKMYVFDYVTVLYFDYKKTKGIERELNDKLFNSFAADVGYVSS